MPRLVFKRVVKRLHLLNEYCSQASLSPSDPSQWHTQTMRAEEEYVILLVYICKRLETAWINKRIRKD
jgi:hypothetical protein